MTKEKIVKYLKTYSNRSIPTEVLQPLSKRNAKELVSQFYSNFPKVRDWLKELKPFQT
jgi:hypothetical protein